MELDPKYLPWLIISIPALAIATYITWKHQYKVVSIVLSSVLLSIFLLSIIFSISLIRTKEEVFLIAFLLIAAIVIILPIVFLATLTIAILNHMSGRIYIARKYYIVSSISFSIPALLIIYLIIR